MSGSILFQIFVPAGTKIKASGMFKSEKSLAKKNATLDSITFTVNGKRELLPLEKGFP